MTRGSALEYYNEEFVNPTMTYDAEVAASAMEWIGIIYLITLAFFSLFMLKGGVKAMSGASFILGLCVRICWFVTIPIVFYRCKDAMYSV